MENQTRLPCFDHEKFANIQFYLPHAVTNSRTFSSAQNCLNKKKISSSSLLEKSYALPTEQSRAAMLFFLGLWMHRAYFRTSNINKKKHDFFWKKKGGTKVPVDNMIFRTKNIVYSRHWVKKKIWKRKKAVVLVTKESVRFVENEVMPYENFFFLVHFTVRLLCARRCFDLLYLSPRAAPYFVYIFFSRCCSLRTWVQCRCAMVITHVSVAE